MATTEEVQFYLTRALGLLTNLTNAIEFNTKDIYSNVIHQFAIIEANALFETQAAADAYRWARGNIFRLVSYLTYDQLQNIKQTFENVFINVNNAWQETLTLIAQLQAAAENILFNYISDIATAVGDKIWDSQKQIIGFLIEGFNYVNAKLSVGFDNYAEAVKALLSSIPEGVWGFLETWLYKEVPE